MSGLEIESGTVAEGDVIPRTHYAVKEKPYAEITLEKYAKEVSIEAIKDDGYEAACGMTDEELEEASEVFALPDAKYLIVEG